MTMRAAPDRATRGGTAVGVLLASGLLAACGGGGAAAPATSPEPAVSATAPSPATGDGTRPEGNWTLVAWTAERSDSDKTPQEARTILGSFEPSCPSGPCDVTLNPAGSDGSFRDPEAPGGPDAKPTKKPIAFSWDGTTYRSTTPPRTESCTTAEGKSVPEGYTSTRTLTLTFVAATDGVPPRVHGTITHDNKGTKASRAKGCTDFVETEAVGGVPTGALPADTPPAGDYEGTLSATSSTPAKLAPVGTMLTLGKMSAAGDAAAPTLTGLTGSAAPLAGGPPGWSGTTPTAAMDCSAPDGSAGPDGADATEQFTDLHAIALTADAEPVFTGGYRLRQNPNAAGLKASCSLAVWEGRILLVPQGAGR